MEIANTGLQAISSVSFACFEQAACPQIQLMRLFKNEAAPH
jgi:hypothetical protein